MRGKKKKIFPQSRAIRSFYIVKLLETTPLLTKLAISHTGLAVVRESKRPVKDRGV